MSDVDYLTATVSKEWLRAGQVCLSHGNMVGSVGVDRDARRINGFVVAQLGPFKTNRGEFDHNSLGRIVELVNSQPKGLKSRFAHPTLSDDGIGKFLGRALNARLDRAQVTRDGVASEVPAVRADLQLSESAFAVNPNGNLGDYILTLAEEDADALSSSLVLKPREIVRLDSKGQPARDEAGEVLPPIWVPLAIHSIDLVDTGDAVDSLLSADSLPDAVLHKASRLLDDQFQGANREDVRQRVLRWLDRYLELRFGPELAADTIPETAGDLRKQRLRLFQVNH